MEERTSSVKTVERLVRILDSFSLERRSWSLAELSAHLQMPKSTLHRFLVGLEAHDILRRDPESKRWSLGYRLFLWGSLAAESDSLGRIARPVMRRLVEATGETVLLTVYHHREVICVERVETDRSVRLTLEVGHRNPPHAGASSKVLMAYLPSEEIEAIIAQGLPKVCRHTITDPQKLREELARIREQGYAESHEETDLGAWGVATPVFGPNGDVIAGIGIAGPGSRFSDALRQKYVALCREAARQISARLGAEPDQGKGGDAQRKRN